MSLYKYHHSGTYERQWTVNYIIRYMHVRVSILRVVQESVKESSISAMKALQIFHLRLHANHSPESEGEHVANEHNTEA